MRLGAFERVRSLATPSSVSESRGGIITCGKGAAARPYRGETCDPSRRDSEAAARVCDRPVSVIFKGASSHSYNERAPAGADLIPCCDATPLRAPNSGKGMAPCLAARCRCRRGAKKILSPGTLTSHVAIGAALR